VLERDILAVARRGLQARFGPVLRVERSRNRRDKQYGAKFQCVGKHVFHAESLAARHTIQQALFQLEPLERNRGGN
jgi:hypothetical protein